MNTRLSFNLPVPTKVLFGPGRLGELRTQELPGRKALIVISSGKSPRQNGYLDRLQHELELAGCQWTVFDKVQANPIKDTVEEGARLAVAEACDFVIGLGGGSVMDTAKVIAMNAANPGDLWQYVMAGTGGRKTPENPTLPWIAVTTTAGTGSEVDAGGVITNPITKEKLGIFTDFARLAIVDPELMLSVPPRFTAYQGFDALLQLLEGYICRSSNLFSRMIQETAIQQAAQSLPIVCHDGQNLEARTRMAFASMLSGYSMVVSTCTAEHSLEHALSAYHEQLPHGAGLIMISLAYYGAIIRQHVADDNFVRMARLLGKADASRPEDFLTALADLQKACGVYGMKLSDYGVQPDEFDAMADNALTVMGRLATQDLQPLTHDELVAVLREAYA